MTSIQQRAALQRQIWQIANDGRGSVNWLGILNNTYSEPCSTVLSVKLRQLH